MPQPPMSRNSRLCSKRDTVHCSEKQKNSIVSKETQSTPDSVVSKYCRILAMMTPFDHKFDSHLLGNISPVFLLLCQSLPCGHNSCQVCMDTEIKNVGSDGFPYFAKCPTCQIEYFLPVSSAIWSFPSNLLLGKVLQCLSQHNKATLRLKRPWSCRNFHELQETATCSP
ncbi:hypothetical protein MHYP_G00003300 [Metynnis hypsauchen]